MRKLFYIVALMAAVLIVACANMGSPDGGPYDETPPRVVHTSPRFGSVKAKPKKIVIEFDENIKLENAHDKVVISPPQLNQPNIEASGKRITIELVDTLLPGMSYSIDFADAIVDNNEGNPLGDYAFTFSTGEQLDTMQMSGYVLNAENLEPIKGIVVGLYALGEDSTLEDSVFRTRPPERISRTDGSGHFVVKGIAPGQYRAFALQDQDGDFCFSQRSEMLAFSHRVLTPSSAPDIRMDTVWHDSIYYDSIVSRPYTHFYPDDIVLLAFTEKKQDRAFLKSDRPQLERFTLFFTAPDTELPKIEGIGFDASQAFVLDAKPNLDTLTYWIRDSLLYNNDTISINVTFNATDSLGQLVPQTERLDLYSKVTYARMQKRRQEAWNEYAKEYIREYKRKMRKGEDDESDDEEDAAEPAQKKKSKKKKVKINDEDIVVPPMPEKFLEPRFGRSTLNPDNNVDISFDTPIDTAYLSMFRFSEIIDSVKYERPFLLRRQPDNVKAYRIYAEWQPGSVYELEADTGAFVNIYGSRTEGFDRKIRIKSLDDFSSLFVHLQGLPNADKAYVQLLNSTDKVLKTQRAENGHADFYFLDPGTYYLRMFVDENGDGLWTTGEYDAQRQAEPVYYFTGGLNLRAKWDVSESWNPMAQPLYRQKPARITKQKADRKRTSKNRNAKRKR